MLFMRWWVLSDVGRFYDSTSLANRIHGGFKVWVGATRSRYLWLRCLQKDLSSSKHRHVVIRLSSSLESNRDYSIASDNFFTSEVVLRELWQCGINFLGVVRGNRLNRCPLKKEETLKKEVRGFFDMCVRKDNVMAVRWLDCRCISLLSWYITAEPVRQKEEGICTGASPSHCSRV